MRDTGARDSGEHGGEAMAELGVVMHVMGGGRCIIKPSGEIPMPTFMANPKGLERLPLREQERLMNNEITPPVRLGASIYAKNGKEVGRVSNIIGPVLHPYIVVALFDGTKCEGGSMVFTKPQQERRWDNRGGQRRDFRDGGRSRGPSQYGRPYGQRPQSRPPYQSGGDRPRFESRDSRPRQTEGFRPRSYPAQAQGGERPRTYGSRGSSSDFRGRDTRPQAPRQYQRPFNDRDQGRAPQPPQREGGQRQFHQRPAGQDRPHGQGSRQGGGNQGFRPKGGPVHRRPKRPGNSRSSGR